VRKRPNKKSYRLEFNLEGTDMISFLTEESDGEDEEEIHEKCREQVESSSEKKMNGKRE